MTVQRYDNNEASLSFGQTHLDAGDFIPPRVKIVQQMAAEAADERAKPGEFFNTLTGASMGKAIRFIPIQPFKQRVLLVREERRDQITEKLGYPVESTGLACRSYDMVKGQGTPGILCAECPLAVWGDNNQPPLCSETYNVAAITGDSEDEPGGELIILGFQKSSAKVGKRLFSMLRLTAEAPWARVYEARTRQEKNDRGIFYVPEIVKSVEVPSPELLKVAQKWARELGGLQIDVDAGEPQEESAAPF